MNPLLYAATAAMMTPNKRRDTPVATPAESFHEHLDRCGQCRDHPFSLCVTGERLLFQEAQTH